MKGKYLVATLLSLSTVLLLSPKPQMAQADGEAPPWGYGGTNNPTVWGELSSEYTTCSIGENQSPINLTPEVAVKSPYPIEFHYQPTPLKVLNNGHTIQVNYAPGSYVMINGEKYELLQFHFHTPSEHTIEEKASPLEAHFVHKNEAGKIAVVGVMFEPGAANPILEEIWSNIPSEIAEKEVKGQTVDASLLIPQELAHYHYSGSLTTPPCSEDVNWNVMLTPLEASPAQIEQFSQIYQVNARPVQPLHDRKVEITDQ